MRIGIIGPSNLDSLKEINKNADKIIKKLSEIIADSGNEIVVTPDKGSVSEFFAKEYLNNHGKKVKFSHPVLEKEINLVHNAAAVLLIKFQRDSAVMRL